MLGFRELAPDNITAQEQLTKLALGKLGRIAAAAGEDSFLKDALAVPNNGNFYGVCTIASSALTAAAHELRFAAARQLTIGGHCFTSFANTNTPPTDEDFIGCMTPRQFDRARDLLGIDPNHPLGGTPFFGLRRDIMQIVGEEDAAYAASGVVFNQITHRLDTGNPRLSDEWLMTSSHDLQTGRYPMGQMGSGYEADRAWYRGYPEL